jgi:hypothetical protein
LIGGDPVERLRSNTVLVNIYDESVSKIIAYNITMTKASELLGTTYKNISFANKRGSLIKYRYRIMYSCQAPVTKEQEEEFISYANQFKERWDDALIPFMILKRRKGRR